MRRRRSRASPSMLGSSRWTAKVTSENVPVDAEAMQRRQLPNVQLDVVGWGLLSRHRPPGHTGPRHLAYTEACKAYKTVSQR